MSDQGIMLSQDRMGGLPRFLAEERISEKVPKSPVIATTGPPPQYFADSRRTQPTLPLIVFSFQKTCSAYTQLRPYHRRDAQALPLRSRAESRWRQPPTCGRLIGTHAQ